MSRWIKIIIALFLIVVLAAVAMNLGSVLVRVVSGADMGGGERDPMFAEEIVSVTRPPEIYPEETQKPHKTLDDYIPEESSPVDKTAQQLILEAQTGE